MTTLREKALLFHEEKQGKLEICPKVKCENAADLALAYTPGVAEPCKEIYQDVSSAYRYTGKGNTVAIITDGTAVLGLGDIGPTAALPVMEGKAILMKKFANIDAFPICLDTKNTQEIIQICKALAPGLGGINLEDISAPRCVEIERALIQELDIPVFHDDQHGTSIVVLAALINYLRLHDKKPSELKVVINGTGAAGSSVIRMLYQYGFCNIIAFDKDGCLKQDEKEQYDFLKQELLNYVNLENKEYASLSEAMVASDIFVGMSVGDIVSKEMVRSMSEKNIVIALANPIPEINYHDAKEAGAFIACTGRSDYPNQVNNLLAFPGIFRGALDARGRKISEKAKQAAAIAIASLIEDDNLSVEYMIPSPFDERVVSVVSEAVKLVCLQENNKF